MKRVRMSLSRLAASAQISSALNMDVVQRRRRQSEPVRRDSTAWLGMQMGYRCWSLRLAGR
jgi:hypothetical protein